MGFAAEHAKNIMIIASNFLIDCQGFALKQTGKGKFCGDW